MTPCSLFIQRADSVFSPVSTAVPLSDVKNFRSIQHGRGDESYTNGRRRIRLLHSQTEGADSKMRCQTWRDSLCSLWTPPCSSVCRSSSRTRGVLTALILRPLSHIPMSVSGCGELGYGKSAKVFSIKKIQFSSNSRKFLPRKKSTIRYIYQPEISSQIRKFGSILCLIGI